MLGCQASNRVFFFHVGLTFQLQQAGILLARHQGRAAVITLHKALLLQHPQVGAQRGFGQSERLRQRFHRHRSVFPNHLQDLFTALLHFS